MKFNMFDAVGKLPDSELLAQLKRLAVLERCATAQLVAHLAEMDARRLYLGERCSSLFAYCTQVLHLSEHAAYLRIEAARAARRHPAILDMLASGALHLTAVGQIAAHLTPDNVDHVLAAAVHKTKREVEELVASLAPVVRPAPPAETRPSAVGQYFVKCTISRETFEKLTEAQALLRHQLPSGDVAQIVDRALTLLVTQLRKSRHAAADRPRRPGVCVSRRTRHIPAAVKRAVWARDGGQCAFVGTAGRCASRAFLEYHHVVPFADGGESTVANIQAAQADWPVEGDSTLDLTPHQHLKTPPILHYVLPAATTPSTNEDSMKRFALYVLITTVVMIALNQRHLASQVDTVKELARGVFFHEGDLRGKGHCNNGWIVFDDYVLVVDANFPSGAQQVMQKIKGQTNKPIRFAFDTHHHGDHSYGNQVWADNGGTIVAHENALLEMKKYETGLFGGKPGRWEDTAKQREDVRGARLKPPSLLYRDMMIFDDGTHRVELRYFGVGHTHGDGFAWLPKERILFTGDAAVNGPHNFLADGDTASWITTLAAAQKLGATIVAPGHGPSGDGAVLERQRQFFVAMRTEVEKRKGWAPERVQAEVPAIRSALLARHSTYIDPDEKQIGSFEAQIAQVFKEITGKDFPKRAALEDARQAHERHHGLPSPND